MKRYAGLVAILAAVISSLTALNIIFFKSLQMETAEQFNKQQLLIASAKASDIKAYIGRMRERMLHISQLTSTFRINSAEGYTFITDGIFRDNGRIKMEIRFVDPKGKILFTRGDPVIGSSSYPYDDFAGMAKLRCPDETSIVQDTRGIHFAAPVCNSGSVAGAIFASMDIQDISREFLGSIKSASGGYAWMMDGKGDLLYHPTKAEMIGRNLYNTDTSCFKCHKTFELEKKIIEGKGEYYGEYVAPTGEDKVLAFSTVPIGNAKWIVAVSAPYSEVTVQIRRSMKFYLLLVIFIFLATGTASVMMIIFQKRKLRAEEVERHKKELEKYAEDLEREVSERTEELLGEKDKLKKRSEELLTEKEKLNTIVSTIGSGIILIDTEMRILWINQKMKEFAGKDITGMPCQDIFTDCTLIGSYNVNGLQTDIFSNLFGAKDKYFQVTVAPLKGAEDVTRGYIKVFTDVTELKQMEDQMMHSEKLAYLGRLTSGIASEIGNPLTSVFSFVEVLKDIEKDEFKKESLETIYLYMSRITDTLEQLSSFFNMPPLEIKPLKINSLIEASLFLIQYDKRVKDIIIVRDLLPNLPEISINGNQLSQVIVNIVLYAADAMPAGGTLTIRSRRQDKAIVIYFENAGHGIQAGDLDRILEPCCPTREKGACVGLAASCDIMKRLNGSLTIENEAGKSPRLVVTLPMD